MLMMIKRFLTIALISIILSFSFLIYFVINDNAGRVLIVFAILLLISAAIALFVIAKKMALAPVFNQMAESKEKSDVNLEDAVSQKTDKLKEQKEFSDTIFSNITSGIMVMDQEGHVLKINQAGAEILKMNIPEIAGKKLSDIYPETEAMLMIKPGPSREIVLPLPDGDSIPIGFTNSPLLDPSHDGSGIIVLFRDLKEIKRFQAELRKRQHFEVVGKVMAGVAHEIRNPLFGISSIAQILEREVKSEQHHALLQAMLKEIHRMKNLIEELLFYSRPTKLNITEIDMDVLMEKVKHYISAKKDDIVLNLRIQPSAIIKADMDRLTQVFLNLMDNAIGGGSKRIDIAVEKKDNSVVVTVKDDGIGIKKEAMEKLFDPFFTTKKEGTGLGLSICKKIIEDHGGEIEIQSTEGEGTIVILTFN